MTLEERQRFVFWAHARVCFENCADTCSYVLDKNLDWSNPIYKPLTSSAILEYGKPFSGNRGMLSRKLVNEVVDHVIQDKQRKLHDYIIRQRNQMVAHIDMNTGIDGEELLHSVRIEVTGREMNVLSGEPKCPVEAIRDLRDLADFLREKALYHCSKPMDKFKNIIRKGYRKKIGEYVVILDSGEKVLRKLKESERPALFWEERV
jgi:hypothetical protein